jgi:hypothetical protein
MPMPRKHFPRPCFICGTEFTPQKAGVLCCSMDCGILRNKLTTRRRTHGKSHSAEYAIWSGMKARCENLSSAAWKHYGGRGIKICDRWKSSFSLFLQDMGPRPSTKHEIERIDNSGNYEPGNCKWALRVEQCNNTRRNVFITISGERHTIAQWARIKNIPVGVIHSRINLGWTPEKAITLPVGQVRDETTGKFVTR